MLKIRNIAKSGDEEKKMDKVGIIKGFDKLGRIVIPKELRERFGLMIRLKLLLLLKVFY